MERPQNALIDESGEWKALSGLAHRFAHIFHRLGADDSHRHGLGQTGPDGLAAGDAERDYFSDRHAGKDSIQLGSVRKSVGDSWGFAPDRPRARIIRAGGR